MEAQKEIHEYLNSQVNPIISQMLVDIIKQRPKNVLFFCKLWCQKKIEFHRTIAHIESDQQEDDPMDDCVFKVKLQRMRNSSRRNGVSGQSYGAVLKEKQFQPKQIKKKGLTKNRILFRLKSTFMFNDIGENDLNVLINAMEQKHVQQGAIIIKQGQIGQEIFILDEGELQVIREDKDASAQYVLKQIKEGQVFGELSLLYNIPRTATIRARRKSVIFKLDRKTFNFVIRHKNLIKKKIYTEAIDNIDLFKQLNNQQRIKLQQIIREMNVQANQYVIREGRVGNKLYMVAKGHLVALKKSQNGHQNVVFQYKQGDYFGQLSLLSNKARAASILALTNVKLLYIERQAFSRIIGPMQSILQRNQQIYSKYTKYTKQSMNE